MRARRKIEVKPDNPVWQEYDREVAVELWHNPNQSSLLRLSRVEAQDLLKQLTAYLTKEGQL